MKAELLQRDRMDFDDGAILEMVIWRVPTPVKGSSHHYKYRLFYGHPGKRIVGYDKRVLEVCGEAMTNLYRVDFHSATPRFELSSLQLSDRP